MGVRVTGAGLRAGAATKKVVVCRECGAKTAVPVNTAGNIRCDGCGAVLRARR